MTLFHASELADKAVIVTGGTCGIGRACVDLFAAEGADVTFFFRESTELANEVVATGHAAGRRITAEQVDVRDRKACEALTRALAVGLAPRKITVNAVAPGVIETAMSREILELSPDDVKSRILLRRFGTPMDVAHAILFLASRHADYFTGQVLHVDGGFKME